MDNIIKKARENIRQSKPGYIIKAFLKKEKTEQLQEQKITDEKGTPLPNGTIIKGYNNVLVGVLATHIEDYLRYPPKKRVAEKKMKIDYQNFLFARNYIFEPPEISKLYFFGFVTICKYIGVDSDILREKIKELKIRQSGMEYI